jgi:hypothetical protein
MAETIALAHGDPKNVRTYSEEGLGLLRQLGDRWASAMTSFEMGMFASIQGNYVEARSRFEACRYLPN